MTIPSSDVLVRQLNELAANQNDRDSCVVKAGVLRAAASRIETLENLHKIDNGFDITEGLHETREAVLAEREKVRRAEADLTRAREDLDAIADELAHAYWNSCGCLAGGVGHARGSAECLSARTLLSGSTSTETSPAREGETERGVRRALHGLRASLADILEEPVARREPHSRARR